MGLNIKRNPAVKDEFSFDRLYENILGAEESTEGRARVRMSGFPFCPKAYLFDIITVVTNRSVWSFNGDFYCDIGTAVHSALQKWIPKRNPGVILGNWSCHKCGKWVEDSNPENYRGRYWEPLMVYAQVGPVMCPTCGSPMQYEEFTYDVHHISGHSDGVLLFDPGKVLGVSITSDNYYMINEALRSKKFKEKFPAYILEFKTSSRMAVAHKTQPKLEHRCQASMYVGAARETLAERYGLVNLDIKGFLVKYIARDAPETRSTDLIIPIDNDNKFYNQQCDLVRVFDDAMMNGGKEYLTPMFKCFPCKKYEDIYLQCPFSKMCGELKPKEFMSLVQRARPYYKTVRVKQD